MPAERECDPNTCVVLLAMCLVAIRLTTMHAVYHPVLHYVTLCRLLQVNAFAWQPHAGLSWYAAHACSIRLLWNSDIS